MEQLNAVSTIWNDAVFLQTLTDRLSVDGQKEKDRRFNHAAGSKKWRKGADSADIARNLDLSTAHTILTMTKREFGKLRHPKETMQAIGLRLQWEEARLVLIQDAISATTILENHAGKEWKSIHRSLVQGLPYSRVDWADKVFYISSDIVNRVIAVSKETGTPLSRLLERDDTSQYTLALSIDKAGVPRKEVMQKTSKEARQAAQFTESISKRTGRPVVYILNARGGTLFGYTVDSIDTQLARQITDPKLLAEFWRQVRAKTDHRINQEDRESTAVLRVATQWTAEGKLGDLVIPVMNMKIASSYDYRGATDERFLNPVVKAAISLDIPIVFADTSSRKQPRSSKRLEAIIKNYAPQYQFTHIRGAKGGIPAEIDASKPFIISVNPTIDGNGWWDDNPRFLGHRADRYTDEYQAADVLVVEVGGHLVFVSEKIENTIKLLDVDAKGKHWFKRNFAGFLANSDEKPEAGTPRYVAMFRDWVPYETNERGEAVLDSAGYVIIKSDATFANNTHRDYLVGRAAVRSILANV